MILAGERTVMKDRNILYTDDRMGMAGMAGR